MHFRHLIREDTHKKSVFFSGRTSKRVGGGKQKTTFFYKWRKFTGKLHNEKWHGPLSHW